MQLRTLGPNGPLVGEIGFGTGPLCVSQSRPSLQDAVRLLLRAAELGVTLWDTADAYCIDDSEMGYGERLLMEAAKAIPGDLRERVVIATKGSTIRPEGRWEQDGRPEYLSAAIDASLRALQTDRIDLWQLHAPDSKVPFADSIGAIAEAYRHGKILAVGLSNVSVQQIEEAIAVVPIASVQNRYALDYRAPEQDGTLDKCRELGLAFLPYSPLGGMGAAGELNKIEAVASIAREVSASPQQVVLAWLLQKYERMIPIPGVSRLESLEDCARSSQLTLNAEQVAILDNWTPTDQ